ncbi:NAC domain containing protein [Melia azedarach]|uniref:NAC domain containing protein n=1 Tax=Melia azedarach TaxID=155640 RepID=A0ACC1XDX0_MELAZ|nr:NAC domain containing protein [Melia azedarach]
MASSSKSNALPYCDEFKPDDKELVFHYLTGKMSGRTVGEGFRYIKDIDVYKYKPSKLSRLHDFCHGKMYFFSRLDKKNPRGTNVERQVEGGGFWRKTEKTYEDIKATNGKSTARKTLLAYYGKDQASAPVKTQWLMEEYMLLDQNDKVLTPWTLCVVYEKP